MTEKTVSELASELRMLSELAHLKADDEQEERVPGDVEKYILTIPDIARRAANEGKREVAVLTLFEGAFCDYPCKFHGGRGSDCARPGFFQLAWLTAQGKYVFDWCANNGLSPSVEYTNESGMDNWDFRIVIHW